ncbi:MAG: alpha/beta hydrolase [Coprococcus sp.]
MQKVKSGYGLKILKVIGAVLAALILIIGAALFIANIKHKKLLEEEKQYLTLPGELVDVDGHKIHVMHEGNESSDCTLVFLHGNRTIDASITLQPLFGELSDYNLIYMDRSGFGFSEDYDASKDVDSMVEESRTALKAVDDSKSYILVAAKSAGVEAIYWAEKYPDEVEAIIGIGMYLPEQYLELDDDSYCTLKNKLFLGLVKTGAHRWAQNIYPENSYSIYTEEQMKTRDALASSRLYTKGMYNEDAEIVKNAKFVATYGWPDEINMYLIYANPFMDPYLHEDNNTLEIYNEVAKQGEEYDCETAYNEYYRTYLGQYNNVSMNEISGPERLVLYNPQKIAELISEYIDILD